MVSTVGLYFDPAEKTIADRSYFSNEANMQLIEQMGIFPDRYIREKRPALRSVVHTIIAGIRMGLVSRLSFNTPQLITC